MIALEMPVASVKLGIAREKDGRKYRMDTATFIMSDGDSFRLDFNAFSIPMKQGDIAVMGVRSGFDAKGYDVVSLTITGAHAPITPAPAPHKG